MKNTNIIKINPNDIEILAEEGDKFIFKPSAEEALVKLLELQKYINEVVENVKNNIAEAGQSINPNFKGVIGDKVRCIYRSYGAKYKYDWAKRLQAMPFLIEKTSYSVDSKKVEDYLKEVKELPEGILDANRTNQLSIMLDDEEEMRLLGDIDEKN